MRQHAAKRDGGADQRVELLVASDGELQMARGDALHLEVLGRVAGEFEYFGGEVFEDGGYVDGGWEERERERERWSGWWGRGLEGEGRDEPLAPTRILFWVLFLRKRLTRPHGN
jgi:hypothetical protein